METSPTSSYETEYSTAREYALAAGLTIRFNETQKGQTGALVSILKGWMLPVGEDGFTDSSHLPPAILPLFDICDDPELDKDFETNNLLISDEKQDSTFLFECMFTNRRLRALKLDEPRLSGLGPSHRLDCQHMKEKISGTSESSIFRVWLPLVFDAGDLIEEWKVSQPEDSAPVLSPVEAIEDFLSLWSHTEQILRELTIPRMNKVSCHDAPPNWNIRLTSKGRCVYLAATISGLERFRA